MRTLVSCSLGPGNGYSPLEEGRAQHTLWPPTLFALVRSSFALEKARAANRTRDHGFVRSDALYAL